MWLTRWLGHPSRVIPAAYLAVIVVGTALLMIPAATTDEGSPVLIDAVFTAVSALCITGLTTVDTQTYWTPFGQVVIMGLIQLGGFGIVTVASFLTLLATGRISLQGSLLAGQELREKNLSDTLRLPARIAVVMLSVEAVVAAVLTFSFVRHTNDWGRAAWYGLFHSVSAFNNAGFGLYSDNLMGFVGDPMIIVPICVAIVLGGIGFPVVFELVRLGRKRGRSYWSAHVRLTIYGTIALLLIGTLAFAVFEWNNPSTLGPMPLGDKLLAAVAGGVFPRTAGFNSINYGAASESTIGLTYVLMFIGGGSAGTAGGIKVGTIGILLATVLAELRSEPQVVVAHRAIPASIQRSAMTIIFLGLTVVGLGAFAIQSLEGLGMKPVLFEAISAFGTVGLSTGITPQLKPESLVILMMLMYMGRVGTISVATALAVRARHRHYRLPEEQPVVG